MSEVASVGKAYQLYQNRATKTKCWPYFEEAKRWAGTGSPVARNRDTWRYLLIGQENGLSRRQLVFKPPQRHQAMKQFCRQQELWSLFQGFCGLRSQEREKIRLASSKKPPRKRLWPSRYFGTSAHEAIIFFKWVIASSLTKWVMKILVVARWTRRQTFSPSYDVMLSGQFRQYRGVFVEGFLQISTDCLGVYLVGDYRKKIYYQSILRASVFRIISASAGFLEKSKVLLSRN